MEDKRMMVPNLRNREYKMKSYSIGGPLAGKGIYTPLQNLLKDYGYDFITEIEQCLDDIMMDIAPGDLRNTV